MALRVNRSRHRTGGEDACPDGECDYRNYSHINKEMKNDENVSKQQYMLRIVSHPGRNLQ
jgi:hypothetical protein